MLSGARILLSALWFVWMWPFVFRAPHGQKRASVTVPWPTRIGLVIQCLAILLAASLPLPPPGWQRIAPALALAVVAIVFSWTAVSHLGKQFRLHAGLYEDHELVRSGPYAIVRHPIYASLLAMLVVTMLLRMPWPWMPAALALFIAGTEIRIRSEDRLLESRFGDAFRRYRKEVPAYLPFVR